MDLKSLRLTGMKAGLEDGLKEGEFLAYASTWTREPDSYGDVVVKGAFAETIKAWADGETQLPILFNHRADDPDYWIGGALDMKEDDHGLLVHGLLDLDNPKAKQVYRMLKGRRINQMSFAYDVLEWAVVDLGDEKSARELRKLKLHEVSIVPLGANQDTEVLAVKALAEGVSGFKAGRVISSKNLASLKAARDALSAVIEAAEGEVTEPEDDEASAAAAADEAQEGKSAEVKRSSALATQVAYISSF